MALYHFNVTQISRGKGQTAVSAAAYRAGEKLHDSYYGEDPDYTRKGGVLYTEILLPDFAPKRFMDRETLWNELEFTEKHPKAQLAYSFNVALQNELSYEENLMLARRFVQENFVDRGMIVDLAIHDPDKGDHGIPNPHFHVIAPIRPFLESGVWGEKQHREYLFDEAGDPILDEKGKQKFNAVQNTDWGDPETLMVWRKNWADMVNAKFEEKGLACRIDERSYEDQEIDLIPSIHEGPAVRTMEARGIATRKGGLNRMIKESNRLIKNLKISIRAVADWIAELKAELAATEANSKRLIEDKTILMEMVGRYFEKRNAGAYSNKAKAINVKEYSNIIMFLEKYHIGSIEEFDAKVSQMYGDTMKLSGQMRELEQEEATIRETLSMYEIYKETKPVNDKLWQLKRAGNQKKADAFDEANHSTLSRYQMAKRKILENCPNGKVPVEAYKKRLSEIAVTHSEVQAEYYSLKDEAKKAYSIKKAVDAIYREEMGIHKKSREQEL